MGKIREYAIYRLGVNAANQGKPKEYVAIVKATSPEEAIKKAVGVVVYHNQRLGARAYSRLSQQDKIEASMAEYARQRWLETVRAWQGEVSK